MRIKTLSLPHNQFGTPGVLGLSKPAPVQPPREIQVALAGVAEKLEPRKNYFAVVVPPNKLIDAAKRLRELGYDRLVLVSAVDLPKQKKIKVVYHLEKFDEPGKVVALETLVDRDNPVAPSLTQVWEAALLQEREEHEMLGVVFEGHPDPRPILLPPDWPSGVYPLRKDFKVVEEPFMSPKPAKPVWELKPELKPKQQPGQGKPSQKKG